MATKKPAGNKKAATAPVEAPAGSRRSNQSDSRRLAGLANVKVDVPNVGEVLVFQVKAANAVTHLGGPTNVAKLLNVAKSQPGRWVRGSEAPSEKSARHLLDLDYALSRLEQVFEPETAQTWLTSPNSFLHGGRPIDVLLTEGPADVIEAIDATMAGSYA